MTRSSARTQLVESGRSTARPLEHLVDGLAVLARQPRQGGAPLLHVVEPLGIELDVVEVGRQVGGQVTDEGAHLVEPLVEAPQGLVVHGAGGQRGPSRPDEVTGAAHGLTGILVAAEVGERLARGEAQGVGVGEALVLGAQRGVLAGLRVDRPRSPRARR